MKAKSDKDAKMNAPSMFYHSYVDPLLPLVDQGLAIFSPSTHKFILRLKLSKDRESYIKKCDPKSWRSMEEWDFDDHNDDDNACYVALRTACGHKLLITNPRYQSIINYLADFLPGGTCP